MSNETRHIDWDLIRERNALSDLAARLAARVAELETELDAFKSRKPLTSEETADLLGGEIRTISQVCAENLALRKEVPILKARVAELETLAETWREQFENCRARAITIETERDALKASVATLERENEALAGALELIYGNALLDSMHNDLADQVLTDRNERLAAQAQAQKGGGS